MFNSVVIACILCMFSCLIVYVVGDAVDGGGAMENASRTTATVKLRGSVDVLVTPLLLESFQRFGIFYWSRYKNTYI